MNSAHDSVQTLDVKPRSFGERLQDERLRLGLTQTEMAEIGGVKRTTQHIYESDIRVPDLNYLGRVRDAGADLRYLVLGIRQDAGAIPFNPSELTNMYRAVDEICVDREGCLLPLESRVRVFQVLCASTQVKGGSTTTIEALREEFARFAGT
ncbi:MAG: helix-turn-helix transcriptional regulator [Hydrogenophaga sp.]|uniref:helix-turn-helix domain-containing protein n=1 Tax=Comamonadaceae TaxID=80864 RepID=UPI00273228CF|nr:MULTISPECIES: helix-turn-helix transcriptional regulator [Comamonadaceae]MDP2440186.1 helix-turn-helix transcriptional regulator [Rhodoferax sp.]MDZ4174339.1 helix-turn-helix transcriptional regulator [Hydrogenophaga sp.]